MKFGQLISYYKSKNFIKKLDKNCDLETSFRPFCVSKELSTTSIGKQNFWSKLLRYVLAKLLKFVEISTFNPPRFLIAEYSLKIKKGLELVSRPLFPGIFGWTIFFCNII